MTTDSDRDEVHAAAYRDSAVEADPTLSDDERMAGDDELADHDQSPESPEAVADASDSDSAGSDSAGSDSAEDDSAEDQDDGLIIVARNDEAPSPVAATGEAEDSWDEETVAEPVPAPAHSRTPATAGLGGETGLAGDAEEMHRRWSAIQASFVDDPRQSVTDAATFLEETTATLVANIKQRESELRGEWDGDELDTEALRTMLRRYRAVLDRIAAV